MRTKITPKTEQAFCKTCLHREKIHTIKLQHGDREYSYCPVAVWYVSLAAPLVCDHYLTEITGETSDTL